MTELIGDICEPSELIVPRLADGANPRNSISGQMFISGVSLIYVDAYGAKKVVAGS